MGLVTLKKVGDEIKIGDIRIVIADIRSRRVKLYMEAPAELPIQMIGKKPKPKPEGDTENVEKSKPST